MLEYVLFICAAMALISFGVYGAIFYRQARSSLACANQTGQITDRFKHFQEEGRYVERELRVSQGSLDIETVAVNIMNLPDTPSRLVISQQAADHLYFENPKLVVYPGHTGSSRAKELGFHRGHIHLLTENGRASKTVYELDFSILWRRASIMAWLSLLIWVAAELIICAVIFSLGKAHAEFDLLSTYALYGLVFFWTPYWPIRVFNKIAKRSCLMVEQAIQESAKQAIKK